MNEFIKNAQEIIAPTLSAFGINDFQVSPEGDEITFFNDQVAVILIKDYRDQHIIVVFKELKRRTLSEFTNEDKKEENERTTIGLENVLEVRNNEILENYYPKTYPLSIDEEKRILRLISDCFRDYCIDILDGDFSIRSLTEKEEKKRIKKWIQGMPVHLRKKWQKIYKLNDSTSGDDEE